MKKIIAFTLCFVMMFTLVAQAMPNMETKAPGFTVLSSQLDSEGAVAKEIGVYGDSLFYYEEVGNCRVVMEMTKDGTITAYKVEHQDEMDVNPVLKMDTFSYSASGRNALTVEEKMNRLSEIGSQILSGKILLEAVAPEKLGITTAAATRSTVYGKIEDELINQEGAPYPSTLIYSGYYRDTNGYLYKTKSFQISQYYSWSFGACTTIAAISALMGFPASSIADALGTIATTLVSGLIAVVDPLDGDKYNANVLYEKDVKVNGQVVYTTEKCEYNYAACFDHSNAGDPELKYRYVDVDSDYNSTNSTIVETGIDIYLDNQN